MRLRGYFSERWKMGLIVAVIADQRLIESCLNQYQTLVAHICLWYCVDRCESKTVVLCRMGELFKKFTDCPLFCFSLDEGIHLWILYSAFN